MRRTARVLYATALAGAALGAAVSGASADPAAEVSPGSVEPGGTVTITVTCDAIGGTPPDFIDASSQGFQEGKVQLHHVEGTAPNAAASYSGTAHISSGESGAVPDTAADSATAGSGAGPGSAGLIPGEMGPAVSGASDAKNPDAAGAEAVIPAPGGENTLAPDALAPAPVVGDPVVPDPLTPGAVGPETVGPDTVGPDDVGPDTVGPDTVGPDTVGPDTVGPDTVGPDTVGPDSLVPDSTVPDTAVPDTVGPDTVGPDAGGADGPWNVDGVCPAPPGGHGKQWTASYSVARGGTATHGPDSGTGSDTGAGMGTGTGAGERPPTVQRGVQAGEGGVFTDSVPALVVGSVLVAGAVGAAAYRLRRRRA
ncbi:hypothetical protein [Streptomyces rhizosphaerihabitans]|uniref:hypothetical protein n=1 Tax=Streptomyces rhizosphaerihabitans TaxID=1266770 RepID=UPI0021BEAA52|nr:hypothetical protein [Streptomyces rhizosphaerihabitans]MCT9006637.1 hypothetical protein [Streptomyces rhizosphaerihabitans]